MFGVGGRKRKKFHGVCVYAECRVGTTLPGQQPGAMPAQARGTSPLVATWLCGNLCVQHSCMLLC